MQMLVHIFNILIDETDFSRLQQRIVKRFVFLFPSESFRSHKTLHRIDRENFKQKKKHNQSGYKMATKVASSPLSSTSQTFILMSLLARKYKNIQFMQCLNDLKKDWFFGEEGRSYLKYYKKSISFTKLHLFLQFYRFAILTEIFDEFCGCFIIYEVRGEIYFSYCSILLKQKH